MYSYIKRSFDIIASFCGLVTLSPIMLTTAAIIKLDSKGPVIYRGIRAGKSNKPFKMLKYRTMLVNADQIGGPSTSEDDPRITRVGKILRKYKLDEIPQLFNVLCGDMSFVGPRPEVLSEVETYTNEEKKLLSVRPGVTDWASIRFNDEGEILKGAEDPHKVYLEKIRGEKIRLGLKYVEECCLKADMDILIKTVTTVIDTRTKH